MLSCPVITPDTLGPPWGVPLPLLQGEHDGLHDVCPDQAFRRRAPGRSLDIDGWPSWLREPGLGLGVVSGWVVGRIDLDGAPELTLEEAC